MWSEWGYAEAKSDHKAIWVERILQRREAASIGCIEQSQTAGKFTPVILEPAHFILLRLRAGTQRQENDEHYFQKFGSLIARPSPMFLRLIAVL